MANPTTNFGWVMPTSTDLVTDLPADFAVFGQGVDTTMAQLKGGTTGQILSKTSNTDMAFTWIANDQGDITAVTAGTGLSGGGTSGDVTLTNTVATAFDAKGDLIGGTGADTFSRLAVGTNGQFLKADSTTATGLTWAAANPTWGPAFAAYRGTSDQTISANTNTKIQVQTEVFDAGSCYDATTNYRFTPNVEGYYQVNLFLTAQWDNATGYWMIYKNGSQYCRFNVYHPTAGTSYNGGGSTVVYCNGTTDYIEAYAYQSATNLGITSGTTTGHFSASFVRGA